MPTLYTYESIVFGWEDGAKPAVRLTVALPRFGIQNAPFRSLPHDSSAPTSDQVHRKEGLSKQSVSILYPITLQFLSNTAARDVPYAHPAAPFELKQESVNKISKPQGSESTPTQVNSGYYHDLWDAPSRFWQPRVRQLEDAEMDAIMVRFYQAYKYSLTSSE